MRRVLSIEELCEPRARVSALLIATACPAPAITSVVALGNNEARARAACTGNTSLFAPNTATFREVAAEAGVSVRLVQYYFGSKDALLLATQQHVAERATARLTAVINAVDPPRARLRKILRSFIPTDDESRENMLMFVALHTAALVDPTLARREARAVPDALHRTVKKLLVEAGLPSRADAENEAAILVSVVPSLAQVVLDGSMTPKRAFGIIDYAIGKTLPRG